MDLKLLTNEELELLIYETENEKYDMKFRKLLLKERNRRSLEE
jgi:hypothetical protein